MKGVRELMRIGLQPLQQKLEARSIDRLARAYQDWARARDLDAMPPGEDEELQQLIEFLKFEIGETVESILYLRGRRTEFDGLYAHAVTEEERRSHVLDFARVLGADARRLRGDRRAFARWFGREAVLDRYQRRTGEQEQYLAFCLERLGSLLTVLLGRVDPEHRALLFRRQQLDKFIEPLLAYEGDNRVRIQGFSALTRPLRELPLEVRERCVKSNILQFIYRAALDHRQEVWIQTEALRLLQHLSAASFTTAINERLRHPADGDDLFVRRRAVLLAGENLCRLPDLAHILERVTEDPSPFVRQALAEVLRFFPAGRVEAVLYRLAREDEQAPVRASALLALPDLITSDHLLDRTSGLLVEVLQEEQDPFVLRVALKTAGDCHAVLIESDEGADAARWREALLPELARLHAEGRDLRVRRWAAGTRERLWCQASPRRRRLRDRLGELAAGVRPGRSRRLPRDLLRGGARDLGRILALTAAGDLPLSISGNRLSGYRLHRGHRTGFRLWRLLHELLHPATDKRQAYQHYTGRIGLGRLRAANAGMAELTETRVPGEPVYVPEEDGWRPYLPLVDDVISALDEALGRITVSFHSSEGVTELVLPPDPLTRLRARTVLTLRFASFARLRNWREQAGVPPDAYARALRRLGIELRFACHEDEAESPWRPDPAVTRFFPALWPLDPEIWEELRSYFFSVYENTLYELTLFLVLVSGLFLGRHLHTNRRFRQARRSLPLVIGGWGTRGKSGTERLKAAMFNALGYSVVGKTTGTEAMFLHAYRYGPLGEMFLFRPYDKATIWEQVNVVRLAARLDTDVFLWECMALTPSYVRIMQQDWMRDDLATITNTYPDHEDLQGPAGIDIPKVMTRFIPPRATLLTSEEQMLPVLREGARERGTRLVCVGWLEAGLLTKDVLARFPYEEHPYNIALVLALGRELGIEPDFALKEMADRVVPDLGVLKAYPPAPVRGRVLEFINGMAANERIGFLGNWERMGFAEEERNPRSGVWITTVVNNREDRVARSRVFAEILVQDVRADRHFLIGSNLDGLLNYIKEAWQRQAARFSLWPEQGAAMGEAVFLDEARRMRVAVSEEDLIERLQSALRGLGLDPGAGRCRQWLESPESLRAWLGEQALAADQVEALMSFWLRWRDEFASCREFLRRVAAGGASQEQLDRQARSLLWRWFRERLVVIRDFHISGDELIGRICEETPPGYRNRIMGCQNIKGPGLDFVYRWQAWERCHRACEALRSGKEEQALRGIEALAGEQEFGILCRETIQRTLAGIQEQGIGQSERFQSQLLLLEQRFREQEEQSQQRDEAGSSILLDKLAAAIEAFLDAGDAIRRRKRADQIYRDLADERISQARAVQELQQLNKRQKGGWLRRWPGRRQRPGPAPP